ncbi:MAG: hypothetical protein GXP34_10680 [Actinobacteria bacterium]|nr:hypothetical protein [Actinomycetota bacterium]
MDLDRGVLTRIDRKLLAGLGQDETYRMVRVPVTMAKWSTWKRYCDSARVSMGRAIVMLIDRELVSVFGDSGGDGSPVLAQQAEEELTRREAEVARREARVEAAEKRSRGWSERLRGWEGELGVRGYRAEMTAKLAARPAADRTKVGRNERCPCGSGLKYKHCHGNLVWHTE